MCQDSYRIRLLSRKAQRLSYPGLTGVSRARQILLDCPIKSGNDGLEVSRCEMGTIKSKKFDTTQNMVLSKL